MVSVAPQRGEGRNRGLAASTEVFLVGKVGEVKAVCQLPGTEGVYLSQVHVCVCCFLKHQLVELPPYPQLAVSLSPHWRKSCDPSTPWDCLVFVLCIFTRVATPPSPLYLRGRVGCISSPGFRETV